MSPSSFAGENFLVCGVPEISAIEALLIDGALSVTRKRQKNLPLYAREMNSKILVPVYVHVIAKDEKPEGGYISREKINEQMDVLNSSYKTANVRFELMDVDYTISPEWHKIPKKSELEAEIIKKLNKGDKRILNLYFATPGVKVVDISGREIFIETGGYGYI